MSDLFFTSPYMSTALKTGLITGIIALAEGVAVGRSFAMFKNYSIDGNKEMIAFGMMNIVGSLTSCYLTTGQFSRSAVNFNAGCKTIVSNIVMAIAVMFILLFLTPLFYYTPLVVLSSIIMVAMLGLIDYQAAIHLWKVDKFDFLVCMSAYFGVVFGSVEIGLVIAVSIYFIAEITWLSIARLLLFVSRPRTAVKGNIPNSMIYRNNEQYPYSRTVPGLLILEIDAPIYFVNAGYLRERITRWVDEEEERVKTSGENSLQYVILDMSAVGNIDTSGISMMEEIKKIMDRRELKVNDRSLIMIWILSCGEEELSTNNHVTPLQHSARRRITGEDDHPRYSLCSDQPSRSLQPNNNSEAQTLKPIRRSGCSHKTHNSPPWRNPTIFSSQTAYLVTYQKPSPNIFSLLQCLSRLIRSFQDKTEITPRSQAAKTINLSRTNQISFEPFSDLLLLADLLSD
ncbi:hypothetical protein Bca4012_031963 [Brassica carinata]|uniref:STAS domain-containing protein n=1 Tax=Brassica oleracea TaxID=3712 RepID=A0A3P6C8H1_BRAOL|nr:unnamed protein product [Brassica oleracea]